MNEIIDVPMSGQRSLATVTAEIRAYQDAARKVVLSYSVEIGRRLVEAKSMVAHGEWRNYLRDELGFSQSTANNHMRLFEAYGSEQMALTGAVVKSQTFANLDYTKALALLALPSEEEREEFAASHDLAAMGTRELRAELRRREQEAGEEAPEPPDPPEREQQEGEDAEGLKKALEAMKDLRKQDAAHIQQIEEQARQANLARDEALKAKDAARKASAEAEKKAQAAGDELEKLRKELRDAKNDAQKAKQDLKEATQNPKVPQATLDRLKAEAEAAAKKQAEAEAGKLPALQEAEAKYKAAELEASKARQEAETATRDLEAVQAEKARLEKELRAAAPEVAEFRFLFGQAQEALSSCVEALQGLPPDKTAKCAEAVKRLLEIQLKALEANKWEVATPE